MTIDDSEFLVPEVSPVCGECTRLRNYRECSAFRAVEIPLTIWMGENKHTEPVPGDGGLRFDLRFTNDPTS